MAKKSSIEREKSRERMSKLYIDKRLKLKLITKDRSISLEERIDASIKLAKLPRNSSVTRQRIRCEISGRSRGVYRKFRLSRIVFRDLASYGQIPGVTKSSW